MKSRLNDIIEERGIKKGWVAEKVGISRTTISQLTNEKSLPTLPVAYRIAKLLNVKIEEIWYEEDEGSNETK